ncbi:MAG: hypothetical protein ACRD1H_05515, partial [Vicinamibacterales bacterium]
PGKTLLVDALEGRLRSWNISVRLGRHAQGPSEAPVLHVHAESDLEALVEGGLPERESAKGADLVVAVDWEPVDRSVTRIIETLTASGVHTLAADV